MNRVDDLFEAMRDHFRQWQPNVESLARNLDIKILHNRNATMTRTDLDALLGACLNPQIWAALKLMYSELNFHNEDEFGMCAADCRHPSHGKER